MTASALAQAAERTQRRAADPAASVWVGASAGTGKTKVLTDRVLRLLLSGTPPGRILCLTFTKAAAAEMADRLAANLAAWAAMPETELAEKLSALLGRAPQEAERTAARRLFAAVLDAPEALRIETLHGFAQGLLRRFPVEAGVSPTFEVMDERTSLEMLRRARERVFREAAPGTPLAEAIAAITSTVSDAEFPKLIAAVTGARVRIGRALAAWGGAAEMAAGLARHYRLAPGDTAENLRAAACRDAACDLSGLRRLCAAMETLGGKNDRKYAAPMAAWLAAGEAERPALWADYVEAFLTKEGEPRSTERYPCKAVQNSDPGLVEILAAEQDRLLAVMDSLRAAHAAAMTAHLVALADAAFSAYAREKRRGALLDYDDLIEKALSLLSSAEARPWVLYKLDGGLDHVLVDEAQDTSPDQWAVVGALTGEFFAGEGARFDTRRTLFAVGDIKQSIYRFQGAEPRMFAAERARVSDAAAEAGLPFDAVPLDISFRSVPAVLEAVDAAFATPEAAEGVLDPGRAIAEQRHVAARENAPGLVELWPRLPVPETPEETPWNPPVERLSVPSAAARCAQLVAERIARMVGADGAEPEVLAAKGRAIRPGDIMVLVRKRDAFQTDLIRALKKLGVAVAGADRLNLADHMAVQDCLALAEAALFPGDDLSLACALKGPFLGWSEEDLFAAAHGRGDGVTLWAALRALPQARQAVETIEAWGAAARSLRPFAFFAR
ncbi:MAG: UvrD-helicase domain-containing protein, partial [Rhodospirillaceae bacterium]